jgi:hypothetical protein
MTRRIRSLAFVVLVLLSGVSLRASIDYVSSYPRCNDPDPYDVQVVAYGSINCEDENERWNLCAEACNDCSWAITAVGVHDCHDYPGLGTFELSCKCYVS